MGNRSLLGRTALVVGGGQAAGETMGNGRATAIEFAKRGANVIVADRNEASAAETAELVREVGGRAWSLPGDVALSEDCARMAARAVELAGPLDILHNNVGILVNGSTAQISEDDWRHSFDVNLTGMWLMCRAVLPGMRDRKRGAVVNVSSLASLGSSPGTIAYTVSKAAVNSMTRVLALENAPYGVRVNAVAPGLIDTPMGVDGPAGRVGLSRDEIARRRASLSPMGFQATAWDVARAVAFLASDDAAYITGVVLPVDGGSSLQSGTAGAPWLPQATEESRPDA